MPTPLHILHLEDDARDTELVEAALAASGTPAQIRRVASQSEFAGAIEAGTFDVILADYSIPGFDGKDALVLSCARCPDTPFIFVSGIIGEDVAIDLLKQGATDYVHKKHLGRLWPSVERALNEARERQGHQRNEAQIRQQAALLDLSQDAISVRDLGGELQYWNRGAENLYGWTPPEVLGRNAGELLNPPGYARPIEAQQHTLDAGSWAGELNQLTQTGRTVVVQSRWSLVRSPLGEPKSILVVDTNITEKKKLESELFRVQRLESIGRLAGGIAHDLNNVLAPILMSVQMLREEMPNATALSLLDTLESSAQRGAAIVKQVLTFARGIEGQKIPLQLSHLIKELVCTVRETFPKNITLEVEMPPDLWMVTGDTTLLQQVLMNLCVNARDAMPGGGALTLAAENVWLDENFTQVNPEAKVGPHVRVLVSDSGVGIPSEVLENIFDPFFTTKSPDQGTGLGLAAALGIVKSHDGFIQVLSRLGKGTEFKIFLPAVAAASPIVAEPDTTPLPNGQGETILIVDDEDNIRAVAKRILEKHGYRVLTACEGTEAVAVYAQHYADIKLVMTDIIMPYMDGMATIRALKKMNARLKLVAASGLGSDPKLTDPAELGVHAFLRKPFTAESLLRTLQRVLQDEEV